MILTDLNIVINAYIVVILILWFESDIITTIANLFRLTKLFKIPDFINYKLQVDVMATYPQYLYNIAPFWGTKLLTCAICLSFWTSLLGSCVTAFVLHYDLFFLLISAPINYLIVLVSYLIVKKLL